MQEPHHSRGGKNPSTQQQEPYYIHTGNGREAVNPPRTSTSSTRQPHTQDDATSTLEPPRINPKHRPEICPPSLSQWQKLKDDNEQRKSQEVKGVSLDEAAHSSGRDQRGFKIGKEEGEPERRKYDGPKRVEECVVM
ncbi:hypothetical protein OPT61_g1554 [Boeremia exigua]|uniref:Uncharacterized protein n=1 Tax=Boeremia exigua TaxID=749465 RepID=A0ACC2IPV7_9PLEO|nr:hypothetical protein OPT61_g1554 [Boeremia exigua]